MNKEELFIELTDGEWALDYIDHDRRIARAIVFDDHGSLYFVRVERDDDFGEDHGPERFSLLYVRGEGVATFAGLYAANKVSPKALAIIQPGHGFGGNWTNFTSTGACLYKFLKSNPDGMPTYVFNGGIGCNYDDLDWPDYVIVDRVQNYYSFHYGAMTVYKHKE
jgi:hypothetical protein